MFNATKIRIFPTEEQQQKLAAQFGYARFVYNLALEIKSTAWRKDSESVSCYTLVTGLPKWKEELPWLKDADSKAVQQSIRNLDLAYKNFFEGRARYPKRKKKRHKQSIQYPPIGARLIAPVLRLDGNRVYLPKVGWVSGKVHREIRGTLKTVTVTKTTTGKYFASILVDTGEALPEPIQHIEKVESIDLGLNHFATLSTGETIDNPRFLKKHTENLRRKQKKLSCKTKGSARPLPKARIKVAKAHERVADARFDFHHQQSARRVRENQAIIAEDLAVNNMVKNRSLAKAISDAGWGTFLRLLAYKLERQGGRLIKVNRFFPSSKTCHACGHQVSMPLSIRAWTCPDCSTAHDRDVNAALNLKHQGILQLKAEGHTVSACGGLRKTRTIRAVACEAGSLGSDPKEAV